MTPVRAKQDAQPSAERLLRPELAASMGGRFVSATGQSLAELLATFGVVSAGSERFMAGVLAFPPSPRVAFRRRADFMLARHSQRQLSRGRGIHAGNATLAR